MSANIVRDFFPGVESFVGEYIWTLVFPPRVEQLCPRPKLSLRAPSWLPLANGENTFTLMWPAASICCVLGIVVGFSYGVTLLIKAVASNSKKGTFTWACAFLWYGLMSVGGLFFHCTAPTSLFYFLDLVSTACACISLLAAYRRSEDRSIQYRTSLLLIYGVVTSLAIFGGSTIRNLLYLGPASLAYIVGVPFVVKAKRERSGLVLLGCAFASANMAIASITFDRWFCITLGSNFSMLFWFFLGSDLAMVFLFHYMRGTFAANVSNHNAAKNKSL